MLYCRVDGISGVFSSSPAFFGAFAVLFSGFAINCHSDLELFSVTVRMRTINLINDDLIELALMFWQNTARRQH